MASTYLTRTPSSAGNRKTWTYSAWIKLGSTGTVQLFSAGVDSSNYNSLRITGTGLRATNYNTSNAWNIRTNRQLRDTNAWYHIVLRVDTTQSTAADRARLYINGEHQTSLLESSYPAQNQDEYVNNTNLHAIGTTVPVNSNNFVGCMSHIHLCDGYSYAPTEFGQTDSTTGEWKFKSPSVQYGTNGFFILKDGNSVTDSSTNSNAFTVSSGTLTNTEDCPSDSFATLLSEYPSDPTGGFANANTTAKSNADSTWRSAFSSIATPPDGKYYMELKWSSGTHLIQGCVSSTTIANNNFKDLTDSYTGNYLALYGANNYTNGSSQGTYGVQLTSGNIGMMAMDRDNNKFWWGVNGSWGTGHNPATNTGGVSLPGDTDDFWHFAISVYSNSGAGAYEFNFGNGYFGTTAISSEGTNASSIGKFEYDVPSGFTALSTKGLNE